MGLFGAPAEGGRRQKARGSTSHTDRVAVDTAGSTESLFEVQESPGVWKMYEGHQINVSKSLSQSAAVKNY